MLKNSDKEKLNVDQLFDFMNQTSNTESRLFENYSNNFGISWKQDSFHFKWEEFSYYSNKEEPHSITKNTIEFSNYDAKVDKEETKEVHRQAGRKRIDTGMHKRKDQVIRDLLRRIRREYKKAFYEDTDYLKTEKDAESLHRCLCEFAEKKVSEVDCEKVAFTLGCLMFSTKMMNMVHGGYFEYIHDSEKKECISMIETVQRLFRRFNEKHLKSFINCGEMATVLIHFPEVLTPFNLSEDEAVGFGIIEVECMLTLNY